MLWQAQSEGGLFYFGVGLVMKYFVYILFSEGSGKFYIGQTNDVNDRLMRHTAGYKIFTSKYRPWKLIWYCEKEDRAEAMNLERKLKNLSSSAVASAEAGLPSQMLWQAHSEGEPFVFSASLNYETAGEVGRGPIEYSLRELVRRSFPAFANAMAGKERRRAFLFSVSLNYGAAGEIGRGPTEYSLRDLVRRSFSEGGVQYVAILNRMACEEYYAFFHLFVQPAIENTHTEKGQGVSRVNPGSLLYIFPKQLKPMNQLFYLRGQYL
jgi:putative endonuclease